MGLYIFTIIVKLNLTSSYAHTERVIYLMAIIWVRGVIGQLAGKTFYFLKNITERYITGTINEPPTLNTYTIPLLYSDLYGYGTSFL